MLRLVAIASLLCGCRISLDNYDTSVQGVDGGSGTSGRPCVVSMTSQSCVDATIHSDLRFIEQQIFVPSCNIPGSCHNSASDPGKLDLRAGVSHDHLVGVPSMIDRTRKLVVPNDTAASYLLLMLRDVAPAMASPPGNPPPGNVGFMPQGATTTLCCQKLDAIERWINAGAPNN